MKIVYVAPHLSTGGCPQYLLKKIQVLYKEHDVYCIEYSNVGVFTVQRNQIKELLGNKFFDLGEDKTKMLDIINKIQPEVVHLEEMPEYFMDGGVALKLYDKSRKYKLIETSHDSSFNPSAKVFFPDKLIFVSEYQRQTLKELDVPMDVCEYPITIRPRKSREEALKVLGLDPNKKHVINVGLFTPRKNQGEIVEYARRMLDYPIQFHFIGNQADNFKHYWEPIMKDFPSNCTWWNERKDVDNFYQAADLFLFTSRGTNNDKETSPLVIREAISFNVPSLIYNLPVYLGMYDKYENISYLDWDEKNNTNKILKILNMETSNGTFFTLSGEKNLASYNYPNSMYETIVKYGDAAGMYWGTFLFNELERFDVKLQEGDVFVDLGANIGMSSKYAANRGVKEIHSFEPDPKMADLLQKNVPAAKVYRHAIDKEIKEIELYHWPHNPENIGPKYKATTLRLKDVLKLVGKQIDYLKIDIEGFEEYIFDDLTSSECKQIKKMFIEHHNPDRTNDFCNKLKSKGFNVNVETGSGQNYIYATQNNVSLKKVPFSLRWDISEQKIYYSTTKDIYNATVSIKDIDSKTVLYASCHDILQANCEFWIIPIPKGFKNFETDTLFGGMTIEVYSNEELVYSEDIRIRKVFVDKPVLKTKNNTTPTYLNYMEFFVQGVYDKYLKGKQFNTVVDVGANTGIWIEYINHVAKCGKIYAIEPNLQALNTLRNTYTSNEITLIDKALCDTDGEIDFFVDPGNSTIGSIKKNHQESLTISHKVKSISFRTFIKEHNIDYIDLLKMDIEGGEYPFFESMQKEDLDKIGTMLVEYHLQAGQTLDKEVAILLALLRGAGFKYHLSTEHSVGGFIFATK